MKKIFNIIILSMFLFILIGCGTSGVYNPGNSKIMYFQLKVEGESMNQAFRVDETMYANRISIETDNGQTYTYSSARGPYYFCNNRDMGNTMTTESYIKSEKLYGSYSGNTGSFDFYIWVGYDAHLILRRNISIKIPLDTFNEDIHKNTALITLKLWPDEVRYTFTLDGFESK